MGKLSKVIATLSLLLSGCTAAARESAPSQLPEMLADTGLYADRTTQEIAADNRPFSPQYPLWTDGAKKRRWIHLPPGASIDASSGDWQFPVGTKLWKEFSFGRVVETRYMERTASGWRFATYVHEEGGAAKLALASGGVVPVEVAPGLRHRIPSETDCRVCHGTGASGAPSPVLGFSALQLSDDRDPNAAHREPAPPRALHLAALLDDGRLRGYGGPRAPRIEGRTETERAALGYLHGNCGGCHRSGGAAESVGMSLSSGGSDRGPIVTAVGKPSHVTPEQMRIAAGRPDASVVLGRMTSRVPAEQMPPLGTQLVDDEGSRLVARWIAELSNTTDRQGDHR